MNRSETFFIIAVTILALLFSVLTLVNTGHVAIRKFAQETAFGTAGTARDVDLDRVKQLIKEKNLSDHEAEFYRPAGATPAVAISNNEDE